jgi:hypothetical protein
MPPVGFPGFGISQYLSLENFVSSFGKTTGNYLPPEFLAKLHFILPTPRGHVDMKPGGETLSV